MSGLEILVIVGGAALGYWAVSLVMGRKRPAGAQSDGARARPNDRSEEPHAEPRSESRTAGPKAWHEVLGVAPSASLPEIRSAYRSLMSQYHPDKVASLGPELRDLAERKSREITQAYREVTTSRGTAE